MRRSRALPYELHVDDQFASAKSVTLTFKNSGAKGVVFHVYDKLHLDRIPRRYTVESKEEIQDTWDLSEDGAYDLWVYGPNGFVREFSGQSLMTLLQTKKSNH